MTGRTLRVTVISECSKEASQTGQLLREVFSINSIRTHCFDGYTGIPSHPTIAEVGIGFVITTGSTLPVIVTHIIGDMKPIRRFVEQVTDVLIIQTESDISELLPSVDERKQGRVAHWNRFCFLWTLAGVFKQSKEVAKVKIDEKDWPFQKLHFNGTTEDAKRVISETLVQYAKRQDFHRPRKPLSDCGIPFIFEKDPLGMIDVEATLKEDLKDVVTLRKESFLLQQSFQREAAARIKLGSAEVKGIPYKESEQTKEINKEITFRVEHQLTIETNRWLKVFVQILGLKDRVSRMSSLSSLEQLISRNLTKRLTDLNHSAQNAWSTYQQEKATKNGIERLEEFQRLRLQITMMELNIEHFWREISHLYIIDPKRYSLFPKLAVKHLLDGFPLELMDGDAGFMNLLWVSDILKELHGQLEKKLGKPPRIFALSVLGVQSSGKSTLFNIMFGSRLRVSVGQCTRGVNMQVIRCEDRESYDYILLIDTEGVRAPEHAGIEGSEWRDNRLATVAVLLGDATIVLNAGEDHSSARDMLPIVLSVYAMGALGGGGSALFSKLFVVYNRINTSEADKMNSIQQKFIEVLEESVSAVEDLRSGVDASKKVKSKAPANQSEMFQIVRNLMVSSAESRDTDIRVLGQNRNGDNPPNDVPNTDRPGSD